MFSILQSKYFSLISKHLYRNGIDNDVFVINELQRINLLNIFYKIDIIEIKFFIKNHVLILSNSFLLIIFTDIFIFPNKIMKQKNYD